MKKLIFTLVIASFCMLSASAQRYAYVDTEYILKNLASYSDAQKELDRLSKQWQTEIEQRYESIDRLYKAYQAEKVLLTEEMRKEREDEIVRKEQDAKELQRSRFGVDGDLFKKREELIQPIQDDIYNAIKEVAQGGGFSVIFDKANQSNILYADPRYDKSDRVLSRLGISAKDRTTDDADDSDSLDDNSQQREEPSRDTGNKR
ncbi:OmpH family outer membrane protein [Cryomorpha ignava]|uniref:OmpH family outer membrane protein n=1 Tax=Cryomorpha ignava TaxID=101383 RepID=A0A7K3WK10_9FLAO|nr:OmpH family outer membrane protein [Cryomorpha ignava]NEN21966.1 OmpH family outer membrane protein [Cryomorpha ignava]